MSSGTSEIEICLHFEQCRADFVSGHFKSETPTDLLIQLVALCVHSTAGSKSDLSNALWLEERVVNIPSSVKN